MLLWLPNKLWIAREASYMDVRRRLPVYDVYDVYGHIRADPALFCRSRNKISKREGGWEKDVGCYCSC